MKKIEKIFKREDVKELLHNVLTEESSIHEKSVFAKNGEAYVTNQYKLIIIIETIIKYVILHKDLYKIDYFIKNLEDSIKTTTTYKDIIYMSNQLLISSIQTKLQLEDTKTLENKQRIVEYAYKNYITEGYCFVSIPSFIKEKVKKDGLYQEDFYPFLEQYNEARQILNKYDDDNLFFLPKKTDYFKVTDSPAVSYLDAVLSPSYLSNLTSLNKLIKKNGNDHNAYFRKDIKMCCENLDKLIDELGLRPLEKQKVKSYVDSVLNLFKNSEDSACILFVERKSLSRDTLKDYKNIFDNIDNEDLIYSFAKIMDSRYDSDKRYKKLLPFEFDLVTLPSYENFYNFTKKVVVEDENKILEKEKMEEKNKKEVYTKNNKGYADVIALTGFISVILGISLFLALRFYNLPWR